VKKKKGENLLSEKKGWGTRTKRGGRGNSPEREKGTTYKDIRQRLPRGVSRSLKYEGSLSTSGREKKKKIQN